MEFNNSLILKLLWLSWMRTGKIIFSSIYKKEYSNQNLISIEENNSICLQNNISPPSITLKRQ